MQFVSLRVEKIGTIFTSKQLKLSVTINLNYLNFYIYRK